MEIPQDLSKILPEARHLGQRSMLPENYDPSLLVRVPREVNRLKAKIAQPLPFVGFDVWQAYEASCLTASGLPTQCVLKIVYPADSTFLVESKSLKLYLHSLNSTMLGETPRAARHALAKCVEGDLSKLLEKTVQCVPHNAYTDGSDFHGFQPAEDNPDTPNLSAGSTLKFHTRLLRSRCRITGQPDWGNLYLTAQVDSPCPTRELLNRVISLRDEYHFHEEICEMLFTQLSEWLHPKSLMVATLYTRRGGIDISPVRASSGNLLPKLLCDPHTLTAPAWRQ